MPRYPLRPGDTRPGSLYWLAEMDWAGRTLRWATRAVKITDADGNVLPFAGGLDVDYSEEFDLMGDGISQPQIALRGLYLPDDLNLPDLINKGQTLHRAPVVVSQWVAGRTLEQKVVRFRGVARLVDYGDRDEPISLTVRAIGLSGDAVWPPADALVNSDTWPSANENAEGQRYPWVLGRPGLNIGTADPEIDGGSPAPVVNTTGNGKVLIAGHPVDTTTVHISDAKNGTHSASLSVTEEVDGLGRLVSTVALATSGAVFADDGEYWARWDGTGNGGLVNPYRAGTDLSGAGDVIRWAVSQTGAPVDVGAFAAVADHLNSWRVDTYFDREVDLWAWVTESVLPLLPVALSIGPDGIYPILWRRDAVSSDAVADIDIQRDALYRATPVRYVDQHHANEITIAYAPRSDGKPYKRRTITGADVGAATSDLVPTSLLRASKATFGSVQAEPLETVVLYDDADALLTLAWHAAARAYPWRTIAYDDADALYGWLRPGDVVTLTDSDVALTSRVCWVQRIAWRNTRPTYTLLLIEDLARDSRS